LNVASFPEKAAEANVAPDELSTYAVSASQVEFFVIFTIVFDAPPIVILSPPLLLARVLS
jgi:hypothetical protein